ncbi:PKD domain-containing protein [Methanohalophilus sp. RSK]|uniref:PKD domain-containing protein n=1 Tax=Methanohalophilus sp. RSK TaxID=2485783 RepID=UPI000F43C622|nr:PKD domain-containing protein [Methanohalophilus sp. RSK]RNI15907.1 PKD domain-containing protein [Methanohalophilus sp. RSK]
MIKRLQDFARKDDAVIEVFSEILLIGIIVIAIAAAAAFVLSSLDEPDNVRVDIDHWVDNETDTLYFRHSGGETVDVEDLELLVYVNGSYETLNSSQFNYDSDEWALGDVIEINTSSQFNYDIDDDNVPSKLVHTASSLVIYDAYGSMGDSGTGGNGGSGDDPSADFAYSPPNPTTYETVDFTNQSSDTDGNIVGWSWDFGDGNTSTDQNPSHQYSSEGTYTATLTVTDNDGNTGSTSSVVTVTESLFGQDLFFQKQNYGGYIPEGNYLELVVTSGANQNDLQINGQPYTINKNNIIKFVMNGNQASGEADIGIQGNDRQITMYDFNVEFYRNGNLIDTGQIDNINIHKADIIESTLSYYSPPNLSETQFGSDGTNNNIISAWPHNDSEIVFYNITPNQGEIFRFEFNPTYTFINGFDAYYTMF